MPEPVRLRLDGFDRHGTTRARLGRRWIEVEHGIPGETVDAEVGGNRRRPIASIVSIPDPSPNRVEAPCPYFRDWDCGGCQWQQIAYPAQVTYKRQAADAAMARAGLSLRVESVHVLDDPWRYRSTAGIALGKHAGFRRHAARAIVPLHDCPISHPHIGRLMARLNQALDTGVIPNVQGRLRLDVRVAGTADEPVLQCLLRPSEREEVASGDMDAVVELLKTVPDVRLSVERADGIEVITGDLLAPVEVAGRPVFLAAASFFQTNLYLLPELIARVQTEAGRTERVADVYGGVGLFGLFLSQQTGEVVVIENDPMAVRAGTRTAQTWGADNIRFLALTAEEGLASIERADVVVVDPPRSGLSEPVIAQLIADPPQRLLYVSCLAESLARDLAVLLPAGFRTRPLEIFDFYPQTYHMELLAILEHA